LALFKLWAFRPTFAQPEEIFLFLLTEPKVKPKWMWELIDQANQIPGFNSDGQFLQFGCVPLEA